MSDPVHFTLNVTIQPEQAWTYIDVPFEIPPNVSRIDVAYTYDHAISSDPNVTGGSTIDIGIFDARGAHWMSPGFRGWSGSARQSFYIAHDDATPGYMPGPIPAGTWHVCLGAYKVAPAGCHCHITIDLTIADDPNHAIAATFPDRLPVRTVSRRAASPDGWYKGELHCHTVHSDGDSTVREVVHMAEALGLDFLAITDHNVQSHQAALNRVDTDLILIPGCEVTTYYGHWNIWGSGQWIDFRVQSPVDLQNAIDAARDQDYLVSCNHPRPYGPDWAFPEVEGYACVETWNGPWIFLNEVCRAFWEDRLKAGQHLVAVGGSDFHHGKEDQGVYLAQPTVWIHCPGEPSAAALLEHLRAGHAFVSESPIGPRLDLRIGSAMMGDTLVATESVQATLTVIDGIGSEAQLCSASGTLARFPVTKSPQAFTIALDLIDQHYIRAQVVTGRADSCCALTNPIYLKVQSR